jgi:hypothetical protein
MVRAKLYANTIKSDPTTDSAVSSIGSWFGSILLVSSFSTTIISIVLYFAWARILSTIFPIVEQLPKMAESLLKSTPAEVFERNQLLFRVLLAASELELQSSKIEYIQSGEQLFLWTLVSALILAAGIYTAMACARMPTIMRLFSSGLLIMYPIFIIATLNGNIIRYSIAELSIGTMFISLIVGLASLYPASSAIRCIFSPYHEERHILAKPSV